MRIAVDSRFKPPAQVMRGLGVDKAGKVQVFATERVILRMRRYMPWLTGLTATSLTQVTSPTEIIVIAPYAQYLYNGVSRYGNPLSYTHTTNPLAGPRWDRTLMQHEGAAIAQDIESYARSVKR